MYITGAILCELAYELKGKEAIMQLYYTDKPTFTETLEKVFEMPYKKIGNKIMDELTLSK